MTRNQIELRSVVEQERHNRATEGLESERNRFTEEHYIRADAAAMSQAGAAWANVEVNRMNAVTNRMSVEENIRYHDLQIANELATINLNARRLDLDTWKTEKEVGYKYQELGIKSAQLEIDQSKLDFEKSKWADQYGLESYKANLEGLKFKESIRQFESTMDWRYTDTKTKNKTSLTGNLLKMVGDVGKVVVDYALPIYFGGY